MSMNQFQILFISCFLFLCLAELSVLNAGNLSESGINQAVENEPFRGVVIDSRDGEPIPGATIQIDETEVGAAADALGEFEFEGLEPGTYLLTIRSVGYQTRRVTAEHPQEDRLVIEMQSVIIRADEVIVTASPVGRNIQYQPAQAYNIHDLQDRQASSFGEMLDGEPGIAMRSFGPAPSRPVIRGFDGDRLLILENGERMGDLSNTAHDHNISLDPLVADRVEVVRGPASLLYGSSALGGVINIITSDVPVDWERGSSGTAVVEGSSMNNGLSGFGRYRYGEDSWAATGRFSYRGAGDVRTPAGRLPGTFIQNMEGAGGFGYRTDHFNGGLSLSAINHNYGLPDEILDPDEEAEIRMNQQTLQGKGLWSKDHFFEQIEFRFNASRWFQEEIETELQDGQIIDEDIELEFLQYSASGTVTVQHRPFGILDEGVLGINTQITQIEVGGEEAFSPGTNNRSTALFTFHEVPLNNKTRLQFGVRGEVQSLSTRPNDDFPDIRENRSSSAMSGSVGLNIRPLPQLEIGAQFARAHRFPILEEMFADGVHFGAGVYERGDPSLGTEVGHGSDLFIRWSSQRLLAEAAGFYYRISNYVAFEPTGEQFIDDRERNWDIFEYRARDAELLGGEAQVMVRLTDNLQAGTVFDMVFGQRVDNDSYLPTMPPIRLRFLTRYETEQWWLESSLRKVSSQNRVAEVELPTDGYTVLNFNAGLQFNSHGIHRVSLKAENITNQLYRDHLSRIDRSEFGFPMPGRNISLSYRYIF